MENSQAISLIIINASVLIVLSSFLTYQNWRLEAEIKELRLRLERSQDRNENHGKHIDQIYKKLIELTRGKHD